MKEEFYYDNMTNFSDDFLMVEEFHNREVEESKQKN